MGEDHRKTRPEAAAGGGTMDENLLECFREDHAVLGRGFYDLATSLRAGQPKEAARVARNLDREAGSHIAFEEEELYPVLTDFLRGEDVERLYDEHDEGLEVIRALSSPAPPPTEARRDELIEKADRMSEHIEHCGSLFEAVGRLPRERQKQLHERLLEWRRRRPAWTERKASRER